LVLVFAEQGGPGTPFALIPANCATPCGRRIAEGSRSGLQTIIPLRAAAERAFISRQCAAAAADDDPAASIILE